MASMSEGDCNLTAKHSMSGTSIYDHERLWLVCSIGITKKVKPLLTITHKVKKCVESVEKEKP